MDRVFLDANVLFSAAYRTGSRLRDLWALTGVELVTSAFAVEEARRNLLAHRPDALAVLDELVSNMTVVVGSALGELPDDAPLADKDVPILLAAAESGCSHLLTGDQRHFEGLYGRKISGVLIQTPAQYIYGRAHD